MSKAQPQAILDQRVVKHHRYLVIEVLVQWANLPAEDATWETYKSLKERFSWFAAAQP